MGIGDLSPDGAEQNDDQSSDEKPSVSYIYQYERGRDEVSEWPQEHREMMATAYSHVSDGGRVRQAMKSSAKFENLHDGTAHIMAVLGEEFESQGYIAPVVQALADEVIPALAAALEEDDLGPMIEFLGEEAVIAELREEEPQEADD